MNITFCFLPGTRIEGYIAAVLHSAHLVNLKPDQFYKSLIHYYVALGEVNHRFDTITIISPLPRSELSLPLCLLRTDQKLERSFFAKPTVKDRLETSSNRSRREEKERGERKEDRKRSGEKEKDKGSDKKLK